MDGLSIRQMSERTRLSIDTLRYYEKLGLLRSVARDPRSHHRRYSESDCCDIAFVQILRETGMPLIAIQELLTLLREPRNTTVERLAILTAHETVVQERLRVMQQNLSAIQAKIAKCQAEVTKGSNE